MDWKQLESYVTVVRCCSFTKAAEELYISQPTISAHIQALEKEYNTKLIQRTTKSVEVTPHGWKVYDFACDVLEQQKVLRNRLQENLTQELRISAFTVPLVYLMPGVIRDFRALEPEAQIFMEQNDSTTIISKLLYDQYDLGIISRDPQENRLTAVPFYRDHIVLITPDTEEYRAMQEDPDWDRLLTEKPAILRDAEHGNKKIADSMWDAMGHPEDQLKIAARTDNLGAICAMTAAGMGVAMISECAARGSAQADQLLYFRLPADAAEQTLYLVRKKDYVPKKYQQELENFMIARYSGE